MSLETRYDLNNIFAKIIRGEIPCVKVFEDAETLAFMDIFPQSEGHSLVISKTAQATNFLDADAATLTRLIATTQKIARASVAALAPDGVRIAQFNGAPAGQTVFHLHFHVIPIFEGRSLKPHAGSPADAAALRAIADRIAAQL